ncbi:hypothetical protein ACFV8Z_26850 [Streptomyces sp. NPDC059837]|jgi:hypothetical protein|uniref:hypothetical protein n=1 Tax=unclassified Streptomyces TaxID=2593676 RepID=UPI00365D60C0
MTTDERRAEGSGAGALAVVAVLAPVLSGTLAAILLLVGFFLKILTPELAVAQTLLTTGWVFGAVMAGTILFAATGLLFTAVRNGSRALREREERENPGGTVQSGSRAAHRTLDLASFVAGGRRANLREEWAAVLAGDPGNGIVLSSPRRMRYAFGFLWAALRMRLHDVAAPLWMPVDWLLSTESRTHGSIALAVGAQVVYIQYEDGVHALLTEGWGWCAGCGIALKLFVSWLRRIRGIELASTRGDSTNR